MPTPKADPFSVRQTLETPLGRREIFRLDALRKHGEIDRLPISIKVLLEACLRNFDGFVVTEDDIKAIAKYDARKVGDTEIPFMPGRVVLQDFTGVPAVVDLAALRSAMVRMGGDPQKINPLVPCDLVIDHSVQVDAFNSATAITINTQKEVERNRERYELLKWAQRAFSNFRVVPPATGIVHQVNLEYLAKVVWDDGERLYPDSLVGTDSHTTMINGLGVLGWGVGGIEAEAVMLGQPIYMLLPEVVGFRLTGKLPEGCTATDLVLTVTQLLREHGVVGKFVEYFGPGLAEMPLANRATIGNMAPEYGATVGFFPVDEQTLRYMELTGRPKELVDTVEVYCKEQGLWRHDDTSVEYSAILELDLGDVVPSVAGPRRPQDRIPLDRLTEAWEGDLAKLFGKVPVPKVPKSVRREINHVDVEAEAAGGGAATAVAEAEEDPARDLGVPVTVDGETFRLHDGSLVIAAITSCTNTSNPEVMLGAGILARKARERGLQRKPWVKTSLAPGSKVVTEYYERAGLMDDLEALGFYLVGYGCTTCIGNSGPLHPEISKAIREHDLVAASILSGNRNFEGRIHPDCRANYLASPPLVVAYAIAGRIDVDLTKDPLGHDPDGNPVHLHDVWPTQKEIQDTIAKAVTREEFVQQYANVFEGSEEWREIEVGDDPQFEWKETSTYIQEPPFFVDMPREAPPIQSISGAKCLVMVGDSVTTDHISPAGSIAKNSPAGKYLIEHGVPVSMFNSYGSRRGNDRVMTRGTFANIRVRNQLAPGTEGGFTTFFGVGGPGSNGAARPEGSEPVEVGGVSTIFDAAVAYGACQTSEPGIQRRADGVPLVVLAGKDYGMGSSRDWAAKGTYLLGIRAVIAESFERIHRSNLVGMGVLPLTFQKGENAKSLGLTGRETFDIPVPSELKPKQKIEVTATPPPNPNGESGKPIRFTTICRIDTPVEVEYYRNGGILHTVLRRMAESSSTTTA